MVHRSPSHRNHIRRLKEQYNEQVHLQKQRISAENEFFANSMEMELRRHNEAMLELESNQAARMRQVEEQEEKYIQEFADTRTQFLVKKRNMTQSYRREMKQLEQAEQHSGSDDDAEPIGQNVADDLYAMQSWLRFSESGRSRDSQPAKRCETRN
jgi:hypothetical protein